MLTNNVFGADNQQERLKKIGWIVGFTDGEGCFSVSVFRNNTTRTGWQVFPEFVVTQSVKSIESLNIMKEFFQCGNIYINHRNDNHNFDLARYCVRAINQLEEHIIPFFKEYPLYTTKAKDFKIFCDILSLIKGKEHYSLSGIDNIIYLSSQMNTRKVPLFKNPQRPYAEISM